MATSWCQYDGYQWVEPGETCPECGCDTSSGELDGYGIPATHSQQLRKQYIERDLEIEAKVDRLRQVLNAGGAGTQESFDLNADIILKQAERNAAREELTRSGKRVTSPPRFGVH